MPYVLSDLNTHRQVIWGGPKADTWFRGGPGVQEVDFSATCEGEPVEAAYVVATDPLDWGDAERITEALVDYMFNVALAALRGKERALEIARNVIRHWNTVEADWGHGPKLRALAERIGGMKVDWELEIARRRDLASLSRLSDAIEPLRVAPAICKSGRCALVYWKQSEPPLPIAMPFLYPHDIEQLLRTGAYRLAAAQVIAERRGYKIPTGCHPCAEVFDVCTLTAEERRLLEWGRQMHSLGVAPAFEPRMVARMQQIMHEVIVQVWPHK